MHFELVPLRSCIDAALAFRNSNRPAPRDLAYYSWRYLERPCARETLIAWARDESGTAAAVTIAPHDFAIAGASLHLGVVGDISVAASHRGTGLGERILKFVGENATAERMSCLVLPNAPAEAALKRAGWQQLRHLERYVRPLRSASAFSPKSLVASAFRIADAFGSIRAKKAELRSESLSSDVDDLWRRLPTERLALAHRTRPYLEWRYVKHPLEKYEYLALRSEGQLNGYAVVHRDQNSLIVDDYVAVDRDSALSLCVRLIAWAREAGHDDLQLRLADATWRAPWRLLGFIPRRDEIHVMCYPAKVDGPALNQTWFLAIGDKDV
jgi:GNAT superfamily N-acetyltransferase